VEEGLKDRFYRHPDVQRNCRNWVEMWRTGNCRRRRPLANCSRFSTDNPAGKKPPNELFLTGSLESPNPILAALFLVSQSGNYLAEGGAFAVSFCAASPDRHCRLSGRKRRRR